MSMAFWSLQLGTCYECSYEYVKAKEQYEMAISALDAIIVDDESTSSSVAIAAMPLMVAKRHWAEINWHLGGDVDLSLTVLRECFLAAPQDDWHTPHRFAHMLVDAKGAVAAAAAAEVLDSVLHQDPQSVSDDVDLYRAAAIMAGNIAASRGDRVAASRYFALEWDFVVAKGPMQSDTGKRSHFAFLLLRLANDLAMAARWTNDSTSNPAYPYTAAFRDRINADGTDAHAIDDALAQIHSEDAEASVQADLEAIQALIQSYPGGVGTLDDTSDQIAMASIVETLQIVSAVLRQHDTYCTDTGALKIFAHGCWITVPAWVSSSWVLVEDAGLQCSRSLFMGTHEMLHLGMDAAAAAAAVEGGLVLEFGVQHGRTLKYITARFPGSRIDAFDTFTGLPEEWGWNNPIGSYSAQGALPSGQ